MLRMGKLGYFFKKIHNEKIILLLSNYSPNANYNFLANFILILANISKLENALSQFNNDKFIVF